MSILNMPATGHASLTPSDTTDEAAPFRSLYIGTPGDVVVVDMNGVAVTYANVPVGILPVQGTRVNATSTTAADIVALR